MRKLKNVIFKLAAITLSIAMVLTFLLGVASPQVMASTDITASFTDPNFLAAIRELDGVPSSGPILASHVENIKSLDLEYRRIWDLSGIEYFTGLELLNVYANRLETLDISNNQNLTELRAGFNGLTALDVSNNPALTRLVLSENFLTVLDVSNNPALTELYVTLNNLTTLDVSNNPALTELDVSFNELTTLDVSNNSALIGLGIRGDSQLITLDVSNNPALTSLDVGNGQLTTLDVSNNPALGWLNLERNRLATLDVSNNPALRWLDVSFNELTSLDVSDNPVLSSLNLNMNRLTSLNVSNNSALNWLDVERNFIPSFDMITGLGSTRLPSVDTGNRCPETSELFWFRFSPQRIPWQISEATNRFVDVPNAPHWQNNPISWADSNRITRGIAHTNPPEFEPNDYLTREMFATFLYRIEGQPRTTAVPRFSDSDTISNWAVNAVAWGTPGILRGFTDNTFRPQENISREQIAVMLFRYAGRVEADTTFSSDVFDAFPDTEQVLDWAVDAMQWATYHGIITGRGNGSLAPQNNATRAETVTMLQRFVETFDITPPWLWRLG